MCVFLCVSVCVFLFVCVSVFLCQCVCNCTRGLVMSATLLLRIRFPYYFLQVQPCHLCTEQGLWKWKLFISAHPPVARLADWPPTIHSHLTLTLCSPLQPERRTPGPEHIQVAIHQVTSKSKEAWSTFALFEIERLLLTLIHVSQPKLGDISDLRLDIIIGQKCWLLSASFDSLKRIKWAGFHIWGESVWKQRLQ